MATSLNDKLKIIYGGIELKENRFDIGTTKKEVDLDIIVKNTSDVLLRNVRFTFPVGILVLKPIPLPHTMVPDLEVELTLRVDTSVTKSLTMEVEGSFLHILAR